MKLNSTYDAATKTWTPISTSNATLTGNNPTVIDLDNVIWKDWLTRIIHGYPELRMKMDM